MTRWPEGGQTAPMGRDKHEGFWDEPFYRVRTHLFGALTRTRSRRGAFQVVRRDDGSARWRTCVGWGVKAGVGIG